MLFQIAILVGVDLGARVIQKLIFDERAELWSPIVIRASDDLPRQIRVTSPPASVDRDSTGCWVSDLDSRGFGIVAANPGPAIWLKSSKCESQDEIRHERPSINPCAHVALRQNGAK